MRAVVNYERAPYKVALQEKPVPEIGEEDVLLAVKGVGVCGSDLHQWHASHSWPVNYPVTLGHEFCGVIAQAGRKVQGFQEGDRVVSETAASICGQCVYCRSGNYNLCPKRQGFGYGLDGAMADYVRVPARCLHHIPDHVPFEDAAMTEPACVACNAVMELSRITPGDTVVVLGPGTIGLMAVQMCKLCGPGKLVLVGTSRDAARLEVGKQLGADLTLMADQEDAVGQVKALGDGFGAHLVVDCVGLSAALKPALEMVRPAGQITKVGWGKEPVGFSLDPLVQKAATLQGSFSHTYETWERVIGLMGNGQLHLAPMRRVFPLDDWENAFKTMDSLAIAKSVLAP
ncbi:MAG TPA: zinc-binding dehydrogenase [Chthonomonadaceae bacterium]|nr:zinc-binding dehydrogenase [Chthonomonadaceae bacterium]